MIGAARAGMHPPSVLALPRPHELVAAGEHRFPVRTEVPGLQLGPHGQQPLHGSEA